MLNKHYPLESIGNRQLITIPFSFESNETGTIKLKALPYRCKLIGADTVMTKAAAASDDGTVAIKKADTTLATVTVAASSAIGDEDAAPSVAESTFEMADQISVVTAKSTAGGKGILFLTVEVLPSHS